MNEQELIKKAQAGEFDAFNKLVNKYRDKIYGLTLKLTGNKEDAEDIMQDTFLKAVDNIDKFRMESSFGTWLYTIALNSFRADKSKQKKMILKPIDDYLPGGHGDEDDKIKLQDWGNPYELYESKEIKEYIDRALSEMPNKYSMPFILRYTEEMRVNEVAKILNLSVAATKSRILRARLALREKLSDLFKEHIGEEL